MLIRILERMCLDTSFFVVRKRDFPMQNNKLLNFYSIDLKYIRELSRYDNNVMSISPQINKSSRPFLGVVVLLNNQKYCIPLTSSKDKFINKKSNIDFIKILDNRFKNQNGAPKLIGVLNINNMIPVDDTVITIKDLTIYKNDDAGDRARKGLMQDQIRWCRANGDMIVNRANKVYSKVTESPEKNINLVRRCCNFKKLESVLDKYISKQADKSENRQCLSVKRSSAPLSRGVIKKNAQTIKQATKNKNKNKSAPAKDGQNIV